MELKEFIRPGKGASDISPLMKSPEAVIEVMNRFEETFKDTKFDKIACIDAKGFFFGSTLAYKLNKGLVPVRKQGELRSDTFTASYQDYTKQHKTLEINKDAFDSGDKVLIIDDWLETGGAMKATIELIKQAGGTIVGIGVFMDDSSDETKKELEPYNYKFLEKVSPEDTF